MLQQILTILFFCLAFFILSNFPVMAATAQLSGSVIDKTNAPINASVIITDADSQKAVATLTTDPFGNYIVSVSPGTYNITVIPPAGSGIPKTTRSNVVVTKNTQENITLPVTSKLLTVPSTKKGLGTISSIVLFEILVVIIIVVGYVLWKYRLIRFTK